MFNYQTGIRGLELNVKKSKLFDIRSPILYMYVSSLKLGLGTTFTDFNILTKHHSDTYIYIYISQTSVTKIKKKVKLAKCFIPEGHTL